MAEQITYEQAEPDLRTNIAAAERDLRTPLERRNFVNDAFLRLWEEREAGHMDEATFLRLVNVLASFDEGSYNDYLDQLCGAATLGRLERVIAQSQTEDLPEQASQRSRDITRITGLPPATPDE